MRNMRLADLKRSRREEKDIERAIINEEAMALAVSLLGKETSFFLLGSITITGYESSSAGIPIVLN